MKADDWTLVHDDLTGWSTAHAASLIPAPDGGAILSEGRGWDYHLVRIGEPRAEFATVRLSLVAAPLPGCDTALYVNGWGGVDIAAVGSDGAVRLRRAPAAVSVERLEAGALRIVVTYASSHPSVTFGLFREAAVYAGRGVDQWRILSAAVAIGPLQPQLSEKLRLVDVGAEGGLQGNWRVFAPDLDVTLIEPGPAAAEDLRRRFPEHRVLEVALLDEAGDRTLNITRYPACSSVLEPDAELLSRWTVAPCFEVVRTAAIRCERYDELYAAGRAPSPDMIKLDVQGAEYAVLKGFGDLLAGCIGIELEAHFYPLYRGQRLLHDLVAYLAGFGFMLRRIEPQMNFDGDLVEVNASFTRTLPPGASPAEHEKLSLVEQALGLHGHGGGAFLAAAYGAQPPT